MSESLILAPLFTQRGALGAGRRSRRPRGRRSPYVWARRDTRTRCGRASARRRLRPVVVQEATGTRRHWCQGPATSNRRPRGARTALSNRSRPQPRILAAPGCCRKGVGPFRRHSWAKAKSPLSPPVCRGSKAPWENPKNVTRINGSGLRPLSRLFKSLVSQRLDKPSPTPWRSAQNSGIKIQSQKNNIFSDISPEKKLLVSSL